MRPTYRLTPHEHPNSLREIAALALELARNDIGKGEVGRNNAGAYVEGLRAADGTGMPVNTDGPWCAALVSAKLRLAAMELGYLLPFRTSRSAKTLGSRIIKVGHKLTKDRWRELEPGDLGILKRGSKGRGGHIYIVSHPGDGVVHTVEGNVGPFPSHVKELVRDPEDPNLLFYARLW